MACEFTIQQLLEATRGELASQVAKSFKGVGTDTRTSLDNQIFVALKGDTHDAHKYLEQAVTAGAKALVVHEDVSADIKAKVTVVKVADTLIGLQDMARWWRKQISAAVFGITGSNGKTSTKEFAATILGEQFKVHYNKGSLNNHWGVPLTILGISKFHEVALVEMGMNHPGELTTLSRIAEPNVVICTTVGRAHIGMFENGIQGIADAKEEIYLANAKAVKIFNYDNEYTHKMYERVTKLQGEERTIVYSSFSGGSEVSLRATHMNLDGLQIVGHILGIKGEANIPIFGRHNVVNIMAAVSMGVAMKMEPELIWASMPKCRTEWGRNQLCKLPNGTKVLFDAYNANPDSMTALIKNIFEIPVTNGKKVAVIGEMGELGASGDALHREIGEMFGNTDVEAVWFMGPSSKHFADGFKSASSTKKLIISNGYEDSLATKVRSMLNPEDIVVIKGSRSAKLERVMKAWDPKFTSC